MLKTQFGILEFPINCNTLMLCQDGPLYTCIIRLLFPEKKIVFLSMKVDFVYASSAEPDEMPHNWHFSLDQVLTKILTSQNPMKAAILNISLTL